MSPSVARGVQFRSVSVPCRVWLFAFHESKVPRRRIARGRKVTRFVTTRRNNIVPARAWPRAVSHVPHGFVTGARTANRSQRRRREMARTRLVYSLVIVIAIAHLCSCARHANYDEYHLESDKVCHYSLKRQLSIQNGVAAIVTSHYMFDRWLVKSDRNCTFVFNTEKGEGLMAVIHKMDFRTNGNSCLDFVQFKRSDGHYSNKFCGNIDRNEKHLFSILMPDSSILYNTINKSYDEYAVYDPIKKKWFETNSAPSKIETQIVISKEPVSEGQSLKLIIVYTPYRSCDKADLEQYRAFEHNICIRKDYVCDKIINCQLNMCLDEAKCKYDVDEYSKEDTATKVTVGAVTTMILCFIIFVMCLWICKKSRKLCWSSDCAGPNVCSRPVSLPQDAEAVPDSNRAVSTAPMLEVAVSSPVADKDLPPSYDSLFPEQSNPART